MRLSLYLLVAFGLGALMTYAAMRHPPSTRPDTQEWGVVAATFGEGARLYGLFESHKECLNARAVFVDEYAAMLGKYRNATLKKNPRAVVVTQFGVSVMTTFSCLPFGEIRGLPLVPPGSRDYGGRE